MNRTPQAPLIALALLAVTASARVPLQAQTPSEYRLKVNVNLVLVPTSVISPEGEPVTDLERDAFEVYENGKLQPLAVFERQTAMPLQLVLMIDTSLSTMGVLRSEQAAAARFIRQVLRLQDLAALYEFSGGVHRRAGFTSNFSLLEKGLQKLKPKAGTALYDAIVMISDKLRKREGRRVLVIVSDGTDTTSKRDFAAALQAAQEAEVAVFSLVVQPIPGESGRSVRGEHVLIALAEMTGGQVFFPGGVEELDRSFRMLSELLRTQYLLGYHPLAHSVGDDFHRIEVRILGGGYVVRHRKGYWHRPE
ncbi:MAG: VWA domain-containing protein [Terriglobia bacterium]